MDKMLLRVLYFSEWFILCTCLPRQYHYVGQPLNWTEAQTNCRKTYTDLATVTNIEEVIQLLSTTNTSAAWIGLYSEIDWKWSDGFNGNGSEYRNWHTFSYQPDFVSAVQFCVCIGDGGEWWDDDCSITYPFFCNRGTQMDPQFVLVNERKTWSDAQRYCRENFTDLVTIRNNTENQRVQSLVPGGDCAWIGLYRDANFYWSDRSSFSFSNWDRITNVIGSMKVICGVTNLYILGSWGFLSCDTRIPFVCQSLPPVVKKQVVKLRLSLKDSSVDLNNQSVKANLLKKLQEKLEASGMTGVTLKWKEQPDGNVFHKER
ncbi:aggrecan core protein-like isoform X3 [Melanotaenia boesemani]|uniref:aggrecan core protein-like isoform X3 n=1 Tax=Melanotaenia boesemani TaxID=1250792 RepID=UPI001C051581|nr:aggrecan core protein-like isoform X3 [Melanotaenia boesemani]